MRRVCRVFSAPCVLWLDEVDQVVPVAKGSRKNVVDGSGTAAGRSDASGKPAVSRDGNGDKRAKADPAVLGTVLRSMPQSLAAEAAVLGSMIVDPRCIGDVIELLDRNCFYHTEHQVIFDAIIALFEKNRGEGIDGFLVRDELQRRDHMASIGGWEYLQKVIETVPSSANVVYYAEIVREKMILRETISAATDILNLAYDETGDAGDKLDEAERRIFAVADRRITSSAVGLKDLVTRAYEIIEKREGTHVTGLPTGYYELDDLTCGLQNGEMIIIAGRPSMGKTSFALNIAEHVGIIEKVPLAVFSLEMGRQQLAERFLCSYSGVDSQLVRKGMLSTEHYQKLVEACGTISEAPVFIDDTSALTPLELRAKTRRLKAAHDIRCVIVDYLQLMGLGMGKIESRQQEISTISRYLKSLARELNVPVVVLSQLNRSPEGREGHRPRMSDLRESGSIEQDADVVMLLHREDYYHRGEPDYQADNTAEVIIAKQRNGPTDVVKLAFREKCTRFENLAQIDQGAVPF
jgi:replicative DNA helicase